MNGEEKGVGFAIRRRRENGGMAQTLSKESEEELLSEMLTPI